jgi:hypothetical protein
MGHWVEGPSGEKEFQQVAAIGATEILRGGIGIGSARNAAQTGDRFGYSSRRQWLSDGERLMLLYT